MELILRGLYSLVESLKVRNKRVNRNLLRLQDSDRQRLIKDRVVHPHDDDLEARKRIERLWEKSMSYNKDTFLQG